MRILRSQYLQLRTNVNEGNTLTTPVGRKVPHNDNIGKQSNSTPQYDKNNNIEWITLTQNSTTTTTTTNIRRKSLMLSNNSALAFSNNNVDYNDLFGFTGFPETHEEQNATPAPIPRRRQTMASTYQQSRTMQIQFDNVPKSVNKINVTVEFTDMGPLWLTRVYQSYENDLWEKRPRYIDHMIRKSRRWYFDCMLCCKSYCSFSTLKNHLNQHLELYPYACKLCNLQYTSRNGITRHLRSKHDVERKEWNLYIGI